MPRVVIVGGGIIGLAAAHYLTEAGCPVDLIDQGAIGGGCSHANCGFICPSHVLPLAGPGMIGKTLETLLQKNSPLRIQPRFDPALWSWMFQFARRCNRRDMLRSGRAIAALLNSSRRLYGELIHRQALDADWQEKGLLFVFQSPAAMDHYAHTDALLRREFNLGARRYDPAELAELEPALKPGLAGAWHYPADAHLRPDRLLASWRRLLQQRGVNLIEHCPLRALLPRRRQVAAVLTDQGALPADAVVIATGAWTPLLADHLGGRLPIQPGKGYSITMARPARCPTMPLIFEEHRVAITPFTDGYRIGSTMEFAGYDASLHPRRLDLLRSGARHYLREPEAEPVLEEWWGWRPMVPDGIPIIGPCPGWSNVWLAAGHGMLGLSMATGTGKLLTEMIMGQPPHLDPKPYSPNRF